MPSFPRLCTKVPLATRSLTQRRKAAKRCRVSKGFLCAFAPLREKYFFPKCDEDFRAKPLKHKLVAIAYCGKSLGGCGKNHSSKDNRGSYSCLFPEFTGNLSRAHALHAGASVRAHFNVGVPGLTKLPQTGDSHEESGVLCNSALRFDNRLCVMGNNGIEHSPQAKCGN